jgi:signal transduction histidine kinase
MARTLFINKIWVFIAFFIGCAGAIIAFYVITQRVILSPIRQLRALANNVAEGNLDIRSSIDTRDEYQKLSESFNHMLDGLQSSQEKLSKANRQLDAKIAELSERNIELFKANKIKSEFLANISHEFRTPLNAILGFAEILREKASHLDTEKNQRYIGHIITGGKRLLNMVNDLLDLAKTEAGKMQLHIEKASLEEICDNIISTFSALAERNNLTLNLEVAENIPELVTDAGKVQQILYNFLSNAIKYTTAGGKIAVTAAMTDERHVRIAVSDTGCGITEADKEKIFEKFHQADGSLTRPTGGSGLGLAISRELAALLAGNVGVESELNKGSKFWLEIPVALSREQQPA